VITLQDRVERLDTSLFAGIDSQTTEPDRQSRLALHAALAERGPFDYLEIGSHLGGSLQAMVADPRRRHIVSIDTRPPFQPDDRGGVYPLRGQQHRADARSAAGGAGVDLDKITTFERGTDELGVDEVPVRPAFCFVDARTAALRDARWCLQAVADDSVIAFHDSNVVWHSPLVQRALIPLV
jgi:hypothetical protein